MKQRFSFARTVLCALALSASLLTACGGRFQTVHEVEDDAVSGGSNRAGASNVGRGGSGSSSAGASSGGTSSGGTSSAGSGSGFNCSTVNCAFPMCPAGSMPVIQPGECCATCTPSCPPCPLVSCPAGTRAERLPGSCCPVCVDDGIAACQMGLQAYASLREQFLTKYEYHCASDQECVTIAPVNLCEQGCTYVAVWYGAADAFDTNLANAAGMYCSSCKQGPIPPCVPPPIPHCIKGTCDY